MTIRRSLRRLVVLMVACVVAAAAGHAQQASPLKPPMFQVDAAWPTIPNNWVLGEVTSIAADSRDRIWVLHRPRSILAERRANAAPPVLQFDAAGKLLASWGGNGEGYDWPEREHGIFVDANDFVWISGNGGWPKPTGEGSGDDMVLKFTMAGKFVLQIGKRGQTKGNTDTANVNKPADVFVDTRANEVYVADGYAGQRVVVFDASSGAFKRMWGAFGNPPPAAPTPNPGGPNPKQEGDGPPQFSLVHAVKVSNDGLVYVADRTNNRIQVFTTDGKYQKQTRLAGANNVTPVPAGFAFSPDRRQQFLYVVDSGPMQIVVYDRERLVEIARVGMRGPKPGEFDIIHHMAADSKGNLYGAEIVTNRRAQRFVLQK